MNDAEMDTTHLHWYLDRMQQGDREAREEFIRRVSNRMARLCKKILGAYPDVRRMEDTGDVLQQATMKLLGSLQELRPDSTKDFYALAGEQIRRTLLDLTKYYRAARRHLNRQVALDHGRLADSAAPLDPAAPAEPPGDLEAWENLHEAVFNLPVLERETFVLIFYSGWPQAEVAQLFDVTERQVRRRWTKACQQLSEMLGGKLPEL